MKLFFNYSLDCELPPNTPYTEGAERRAFFGGPASWQAGEASVRGFIDQMERLGVRAGATLFVYPDVARCIVCVSRPEWGSGLSAAIEWLASVAHRSRR